jgi:hypothetical protein
MLVGSPGNQARPLQSLPCWRGRVTLPVDVAAQGIFRFQLRHDDSRMGNPEAIQTFKRRSGKLGFAAAGFT